MRGLVTTRRVPRVPATRASYCCRMAAPSWEQRERPILEAILQSEEAGTHRDMTVEVVAEMTGLEPAVVGRALQSLIDARFVDAIDSSTFGSSYPEYMAPRLLERGRRDVGQWPPGIAEAFTQRLDSLISTETDPTAQTRLRRLKEAAGEVSKGVVSGAIVAAGQWAAGQ